VLQSAPHSVGHDLRSDRGIVGDVLLCHLRSRHATDHDHGRSGGYEPIHPLVLPIDVSRRSPVLAAPVTQGKI
jgi:hypothetical protein